MGVTRNVEQKEMEELMNIDGFLASLQTSSAETLRAYRQDLERFEDFLKQKGLRVTQVKPSTVADFTQYLSEHKGRTPGDALAPATIARRLAVISSYYEYLRSNSEGRIRNPVVFTKRPKVQNALPRAVEDNVLVTLVDGITDLRDKAIVLLFIYSGLRLKELRDLDVDSLTLRRRTLADGAVDYYGVGEVVNGKGGKRRIFLVGKKAMEAIGHYVSSRQSSPAVSGPLFLSSRKQRLSSRAIQQIVDKWCKRVGIDHIHVHQLRHSFATRNVNAGMSSVVLRDLMGHSSLPSTQRYYQVKPERLSREYHSVMEFVNKTQAV